RVQRPPGHHRRGFRQTTPTGNRFHSESRAGGHGDADGEGVGVRVTPGPGRRPSLPPFHLNTAAMTMSRNSTTSVMNVNLRTRRRLAEVSGRPTPWPRTGAVRRTPGSARARLEAR